MTTGPDRGNLPWLQPDVHPVVEPDFVRTAGEVDILQENIDQWFAKGKDAFSMKRQRHGTHIRVVFGGVIPSATCHMQEPTVG